MNLDGGRLLDVECHSFTCEEVGSGVRDLATLLELLNRVRRLHTVVNVLRDRFKGQRHGSREMPVFKGEVKYQVVAVLSCRFNEW